MAALRGNGRRLVVGLDDRHLRLRLAQQRAQGFDAGATQRDRAEADEAPCGTGAPRLERVEPSTAARAPVRRAATFGDLPRQGAVLYEAIDGVTDLGGSSDKRVGARGERPRRLAARLDQNEWLAQERLLRLEAWSALRDQERSTLLRGRRQLRVVFQMTDGVTGADQTRLDRLTYLGFGRPDKDPSGSYIEPRRPIGFAEVELHLTT
jgi:hypothetical protein